MERQNSSIFEICISKLWATTCITINFIRFQNVPLIFCQFSFMNSLDIKMLQCWTACACNTSALNWKFIVKQLLVLLAISSFHSSVIILSLNWEVWCFNAISLMAHLVLFIHIPFSICLLGLDWFVCTFMYYLKILHCWFLGFFFNQI